MPIFIRRQPDVLEGAHANNGNYHNAALNFIIADASGNAPYGQSLVGASGGSTSTGTPGSIYALAVGADTVPTAALPNTNDDRRR